MSGTCEHMNVLPFSAGVSEPSEYWLSQGWAFHLCGKIVDWESVDFSGPVPTHRPPPGRGERVPSTSPTQKDPR